MVTNRLKSSKHVGGEEKDERGEEGREGRRRTRGEEKDERVGKSKVKGGREGRCGVRR